MQWNRVVLREIGNEIDILAIHHYYGVETSDTKSGRANLMSKPLWYENFYSEVRDLIDELQPERNITVAINEWGTSLPLPRQNTMQSALYGARLMNAFERQGDLIEMSAVSDLVNGWPGGIIQASRRQIFTTPNYAVIKAYNKHRGDWRVESDMKVNVFHQPDAPTLGTDVPVLDVTASVKDDGREIQLKVVNSSMETDIPSAITIEHSQTNVISAVQAITIRGENPGAYNDFRHPDLIKTHHQLLSTAGNSFSFTFRKHSVTLLILKAGDKNE